MESEGLIEKRNLTVLSFAIVVFYLAGGSISFDDVRLGIFNAHFEHTYIIVAAIWLVLIWFAFRYWVTTKGKYLQEHLVKYLHQMRNGWSVRAYFRSRFGKVQFVKGDADLTQKDVGKLFFGINKIAQATSSNILIILWQPLKVDGLDPIRRSEDDFDKYSNIKGVSGNQLSINGLSGFLLKVYIALKKSLIEPAFSQMIIPYILFAMAIGLGLHDLSIPNTCQG
jgi:hypothetical protein